MARTVDLHQPRAARHCLEAVSREGPPEAVLKEAWSSTALRGTASRQCLGKGLRTGNPQESTKPQEGWVQPALGCEALPRGNVSGRLYRGSAFRRQVWAARHCLETVPWESPPEAAHQGGLHQPRAARRCLEAVSREGRPEAVLKEAWSSTALRGTASRQCLRKDLSRQLPAK